MYITTRFQSSHYNTSICMLLVCMITMMANYGIRNGPKHKHVHLQEWLKIVYWRQKGFFTLKLTHRKVSEIKKNNNNRWPIYCQGICCLGRFILVFLFTQSLTLVHKTRTQTRKRLVTTPKGMLVRPCSRSRCVLTLLPEPERRPSTITHMHTHWNICSSSRRGAVQCSVCSREELNSS